MKNKLVLSLCLTFGCLLTSYGQLYSPSAVTNELGFTTGLVSFQSDYGESGNFRSTTGNIGFHIGLVYFMDFSYSRGTYFSEHFKVKAELSYNKVNFKHYGSYTEGTSLFSKQLQAMNGNTSIFNIGTELVWFPLDLVSFNYSPGSFTPFASLGGQINFYTPTVQSDLGPLGSPLTTPVKYMNSYTNDGGTTFSFVGSIGTRYKISRDADLSFEIRGQYFMSDWVDGLKPDPSIYSENKSNDFLVSFNVGYIFMLD